MKSSSGWRFYSGTLLLSCRPEIRNDVCDALCNLGFGEAKGHEFVPRIRAEQAEKEPSIQRHSQRLYSRLQHCAQLRLQRVLSIDSLEQSLQHSDDTVFGDQLADVYNTALMTPLLAQKVRYSPEVVHSIQTRPRPGDTATFGGASA